MNKLVCLYIKGGCGNQFFQYAFARQIQEKSGGKLCIIYENLLKDANPWASNDILPSFKTSPHMSSDKGILKGIWLKIIYFYVRLRKYASFEKRTYKFMLRLAKWLPYLGVYYFDAAYYDFPISRSRTIVIDGYFESAKYFADIDEKIRKELTPKHPPLEQNKELLDIINERESVCVTIKRYDIEQEHTAEVYGYDINYFYAGISYIKKQIENPVFIIFADDIDWCRKNVHIDGEVYFETDGNPIWEKMRLMSSCKHFIIHNSTFSWWAQHLSSNPDKIVLGPYKWLQRDDQPIDIYEPNWLYITPDGNIAKNHA